MGRSVTTTRPSPRAATAFGARALAGVLLAVLAVWPFVGCQRDLAEDPGDASLLPDSEIDGFKLTQTREGEKIWVLSASRALVYEEADRVVEITRRSTPDVRAYRQVLRSLPLGQSAWLYVYRPDPPGSFLTRVQVEGRQ